VGLNSAPEGRNLISLGRQPQVSEVIFLPEPRRGDTQRGKACRPLGAQ